MGKLKHNQKGFTILELLIATTIFSVVLLVFLSAFLRISELFYKGINLSNTQETARNIVQTISDDILFYHLPANVFASPAVGHGYFCVGNDRYTYDLGTPYIPKDTNHFGIIKEVISGGCISPFAPTTKPYSIFKGQELLDPGMQLNKLMLTCGGGLCSVAIHLVYYSNDHTVLYSPLKNPLGYQAPDAQCTGPVSGSQYCATADYTTTVLQSY